MKSSAKKVELAPYDDLFSTEESRQDAKLEKVREIPLSELHPFKNHPFKVKDDEAMLETADSVRQYGILVPAGYITYMPDSKDRFLGAMLYTGGPVVEGINWYVGPAR